MNIQSIYARISPYFRRRRMKAFLDAMQPPGSSPLLDLGGHPWGWALAGVSFPVVMVNIDIPAGAEQYAPKFTMIQGDATRLPFADGSYEIVYSNSVIEHLGTWENQQAFAREARRVGRRLWIQTPARWFPIEPHLIAPFVHYFSKGIQRRLLRWFTVWGWLTKPTLQQVDAFLAEVRLLTAREMQTLFPDCQILRERLFGLTKSYIAVRH
ncbi:MAG: methyltransferase domain-containing protein [Verrucomicrobiota bacterium]